MTAAASCFLPGFEKVDTAATGGGGSGGAEEDPCSARWPDGAPGTSADTDNLTVSLAMRTVDIGEVDPTNAPGFDLDEACTCCPDCTEGQACTPPADPICDGPRGRDNAVAHFLARLLAQLPSPVTSQSLQTDIDEGDWTVLARVSRYNGLADDSDVTVTLYGAAPLGTAPQWNGGDTWNVRDDYVTAPNLDAAVVRSDAAYLSGGVLVARFGSGGPLRISLTSGFDLRMTSAVLSGTLALENGRYALSGATLGGVWSMPDVFRTLAAIRVGGAAAVCLDSPTYPTVKALLCDLRDSLQAIDAFGPCTSVSFGLAFRAEQVVFGQLVPPPPPGTPCADGFSPEGDSCT